MISEVIADIAKKAEAKMEQGDYIQDGLIYCGNCRTPKQYRIDFGLGLTIVGCQCACAERRYKAEEEARKNREERSRIESLRVNGISDKSLRNCRFESARETEILKKCRKYVDDWKEAYKSNIGLLFWGNTGNGKTFSAACIANELIDRGVPAMITSFPRILSGSWDERQEIIEQLSFFPLLVIDDLGSERQSDFSLEIVYAVIDERYKSGKPLIVTTNLTLEEMKNPKNMNYQRIYDRVMEMCTPICFRGETMRTAESERKMKIASEIFGKDSAI